MRAAPRWMMASGSAAGSRQAMPSAKVAAELVGTGRPCSNDNATAGAPSATTPMISVSSPSRSRTVIRPQMPDPMPIGRVDGIEIGHGLEHLQRVGGHALDQVGVEGGHEVIAALVGEFCRMRPALVEVGAGHDQLGAEGLHGSVLLARVAARHEDRARNAGARRGQRDRLAMVAARRGDDAIELRPLRLRRVEIDDAAAHLEGADGRMVLVLDPHLRARTLGQQAARRTAVSPARPCAPAARPPPTRRA